MYIKAGTIKAELSILECGELAYAIQDTLRLSIDQHFSEMRGTHNATAEGARKAFLDQKDNVLGMMKQFFCFNNGLDLALRAEKDLFTYLEEEFERKHK